MMAWLLGWRGRGLLVVAGLLAALGAGAQVPEAPSLHPAAAPAPLDVADVAHRLYPRLPAHDSAGLARGHRVLLLVPVVGYSQQTGGVAELALNAAYQQPGANVSTIVGAAEYSLHQQQIFTLQSAIWTTGNRWALLGDWRVMKYPQSTYGLGMFTSTDQDVVSMDFKYLRLYQTLLRRVAPAWYVGAGLQLDDHWDIVSRNRRREVTTISHYPYGVTGRSLSVGPVLSVLHDGRTNAINPQGGYLLNVQYRPNLTALGSDRSFQSLIVEGRWYLHPSPRSANILALWSYNTFTLSGNPPFLDLPATGWDMYGNTGRGFIQGRFRGKNLVYAEAEYRFGITRSQLLGGVVFGNAQSVTELGYARRQGVTDEGFQKVVPALGTGLRINLNKYTRTNLAIDYAWGFDGSRGLALNLGEVF